MSQAVELLIVDDDPTNLARLRAALAPLGKGIAEAGDGAAALQKLAQLSKPNGYAEIVITDLKMPVMDGLQMLREIARLDADLPVILVSSYGDIDSAVQAMKAGAYDFIERPIDIEDLLLKTGRALEKRRLVIDNRRLKVELANRSGIGSRLLGDAPAMQALREEIAVIADTDATVLIYGETGAGKEVVARALHECSPRGRSRFVAINCGALSENLIESELFGHEPGAFTDAKQRRIGLVEHAKGGTLFLDEIESMPLGLQVKLLRMLQERVITRLGSNELIKVDIRVVAATKTDLLAAARRGTFREDLYFRLGVAELHIPRLNDRREDIPLLFTHFVESLAAHHQREVPKVAREDMERLLSHDWRGNVRELRNVAERFVLGIGRGAGGLGKVLGAEGSRPKSLPDQMDAVEAILIRAALSQHDWNVQATADGLGIPRRTLNEKMRRHGLDRKALS